MVLFAIMFLSGNAISASTEIAAPFKAYASMLWDLLRRANGLRPIVVSLSGFDLLVGTRLPDGTL